MNKAQHTTSCIVHLADSANFKGVTSNKRCSGLTGSCFEMPNDTIPVSAVMLYTKNEHDERDKIF
jgi:hypothetical protein